MLAEMEGSGLALWVTHHVFVHCWFATPQHTPHLQQPSVETLIHWLCLFNIYDLLQELFNYFQA